MIHKITLTDREFATVHIALKELADRWIDPLDPDLASLLTNQFSVELFSKITKKETSL